MVGILSGIDLSLSRYKVLSRVARVVSMGMHTACTIEMVRGKMPGRMIQNIVGVRKKILNPRVSLVQLADHGCY